MYLIGLIIEKLEELSENQTRAMKGSTTEVAHVRIAYVIATINLERSSDLLKEYETIVTLL